MNCEKGDLAIVVRSDAGNEGRVVRCLELLGLFFAIDRNGDVSDFMIPWWRIDQMLPARGGLLGNEMADDQLRPIRDPGPDAVDETLEWLPVPHKEHA